MFLGVDRVVPNPPDCENYDNYCDDKDRDAAPIKAWLAILPLGHNTQGEEKGCQVTHSPFRF
jgi:hypothetical protein